MVSDNSLNNSPQKSSFEKVYAVPVLHPCSGMAVHGKTCSHVRLFTSREGWDRMLKEVEDPASEGCCYLFSTTMDPAKKNSNSMEPKNESENIFTGSVTVQEKKVRSLEIRIDEDFSGKVSLDVYLGFQASLGIIVRGTVRNAVSLTIRSYQEFPESRFICKEKLVCLPGGKIDGKTFGKVFESAKGCACEFDVKVLQPIQGGVVRLEPHLDAYGKEIEAVHGCSVGRVPVDALLYLESRGLDRGEAEKIYLEGFLR